MTELADDRQLHAGQPLPRCCDSHPDWPTLTHHLVDAFPELRFRDIVREVRSAKVAVESASLAGVDAVTTGEVIARHQLMLLAGRLEDAARLDPERHLRKLPPVRA